MSKPNASTPTEVALAGLTMGLQIHAELFVAKNLLLPDEIDAMFAQRARELRQAGEEPTAEFLERLRRDARGRIDLDLASRRPGGSG